MRSVARTRVKSSSRLKLIWVPKIFDRSMVRKEGVKDCEQLLNQRTIEILETHQPRPVSDDLVKELKKVEKTWFDRIGLKQEYPERK